MAHVIQPEMSLKEQRLWDHGELREGERIEYRNGGQGMGWYFRPKQTALAPPPWIYISYKFDLALRGIWNIVKRHAGRGSMPTQPTHATGGEG